MTAAQTDISTVATRLKSTATTYTSGYAAGVDWAKAVATAEQLEVLEGWDWEAKLDQAECNGGELFAADVADALFVQEWHYGSATEVMGGRITERRVEGFIEGAMSVWKQAKQLM